MKTHRHIAGDEATTSSETSNTNSFTGASIEMVPLDELLPHPLSGHIYGSGTVPEDLLESVRVNKIQSPIIVSSASKRIISGHTRVAAARRVGHTAVPVIYQTMSECDEEFGVVQGNVTRQKTNSMKCREFAALLDTFKKKAASGDPDLSPKTAGLSKSQDKAAALIGVGASSLKKGVEVLKAAETLASAGDDEGAGKLRTLLDKPRGFDPSHQAAVKMGVIAPSKKRPKKNVAKAGIEPSAVGSVDQEDTGGANPIDINSESQSQTANSPQSVAEEVSPQPGASPVAKLEGLVAALIELLQEAGSWPSNEQATAVTHLEKLEDAVALASKTMKDAVAIAAGSLN